MAPCLNTLQSPNFSSNVQDAFQLKSNLLLRLLGIYGAMFVSSNSQSESKTDNVTDCSSPVSPEITQELELLIRL